MVYIIYNIDKEIYIITYINSKLKIMVNKIAFITF